MKLLIKNTLPVNRGRKKNYAVMAACTLLLIITSRPALAAEQEPFGSDGSVWMSLEHYTDKTDRFPELQEQIQEKLQSPVKPIAGASAKTEPAGVAPEQSSGQETLLVTQPVRPLTPPVLPGVNQGYALQVNSTQEEDNKEDPAATNFIQPMRQLQPPVMPGLNQRQDTNSAPTETEEENKDTAEAAAAEAAAAKAAALTQTIRQLTPPVMPGVAPEQEKNQNITDEENGGSAEDAAEAASAAAEAAAAAETAARAAALAQAVRQISMPVMPGPGQSTAADTAFLDGNEETDNQTEGGGKSPLNVRFAKLPGVRTASLSATPAIKPSGKTKAGIKPDAKTASMLTAAPRNPQACEALTAYRKKQLAAIESDRQTLNALQAAIAELGLDKKIDFSHGASGALSSSPPTEQGLKATPETTNPGGNLSAVPAPGQ